MRPIILTGHIDEHRQLHVELPADAPVGQVKLVITPQPETSTGTTSMTREEARAKLMAAGALVVQRYAPDDAVELTDEEAEALGDILAGGRPLSEIIIEDREDRI